MKLGITYRLFLVLLAATGLVALGMFLIAQWSIDRGFLQYVNTLETERLERLATELERFYADGESWDPLRNDPAAVPRLLLRTLPGEGGERERQRLERLERRLREGVERPPLPPGSAHRFEARVVLLDGDRRPVLGPPAPGRIGLRPLRRDGATVGYLGLLPRRELSDVHQLRFVKEQKLALGLVAALLLFVSALLALPLANRLVRPLRALAAATRRLAAGDYASRVPVDSSDELGRLARDFNALALALEKNEQSRRQWVADISHELRTPLAVLRGEIEALQDGVRQPTPEAIGSLHGEALRLGRLVDDLYQLAVSDVGALAYRMEPADLGAILEEALAPFRPRFAERGIALTTPSPGTALPLLADAERLHQLFDNLLDNALKYTDAGGRVEVRLEQRRDVAAVHVADSAPGVPEETLGRLFERLFRVEGSRSRETGGAGLGLAICRNIVEAHGGTISARPSPLGGVWLTIELPTERSTA